MPYKFNPFTGTFDDSTTGPQGPAGTVSAAGSGTAAAPGIAFSADPNTGIYNPSADNIAISTGGTGWLFIDANGNVGIGAAPSAYKSSYTGFDIRTGSLFSAAGVGLVSLASNVYYNNSNQFIYKETDAATLYQGYSGVHTFHTAGSGTAGTVATLTERMRLTSAGLLGLGTSSPVAFLHVSGSGASSCRLTDTQSYNFGTSGPTLDLTGNDSSGANTLLARLKGSPNNGNPDRGFLDILTRVDGITTSTLQVGTGLAANVLIPNGRVGIGTLSPQGLMHLQQSLSDSTPILVLGEASNNVRYSIIQETGYTGFSHGNQNINLKFKTFANGGTGGQIQFWTGVSSASQQVTIDSSGRVGIGITSPLFPLDVNGVIYTRGRGSTFGVLFDDWRIYNSTSPGALVFDNGTERARIDSSGRVGIGTASPTDGLHVYATSTTNYVLNLDGPYNGSDTNNYIAFSGNGTKALIGKLYRPTAGNAIRLDVNFADFIIGTGSGGTASERARIDSSGRLLVGTSTARANFTGGTRTSSFQIEGTSLNDSALSILRNSNDTGQSAIYLAKSRSTTVGDATPDIVADGDSLGSIFFQGADNTNFVSSASITAQVDGTPGSNDMPGRLVFSTTADGASSPTERLRITSAGRVGIGTVSPGSALEVNAAAATSPFIAKINTTEVARVDSSGRVLVGAASSDTALVDASVQSVPPANTPALGLLRSATVAGNTTATILTTANTSSAFLVVGIRGNAGSKTFLCHRGSSTVTEIATAGTFDGSLAWSTNNLQGTSTSASSTVWSIIAFA
jgi:hypothetical protein